MLSKILNKFPITVKVTIWYTFFIVLLLTAIIAASFFVTKQVSLNVTENELISRTGEIAADEEDFETFDEGIYFSIYNRDGEQKKGIAPKGFDRSLPMEQGGINEYNKGKESFLYVDVPVKKGSAEAHWVRGVVSVSREAEKLLYFPIGVAIVSPLLLLIIAFGGYRIIKSAFKPVRAIVQTASDIGQNRDFSKRIPLQEGKKDEIHQMSLAFNEMLDSLEDSYKYEKRFSGDVSHELRTPVSVILAESQYGKEHTENLEEAKKSFAVIERQSQRMTHMINQILEIYKLERMEDLHFEQIDLSRMVAEMVQDYAVLLERNKIVLSTDIAEGITVSGNRSLLQRALDNLVRNGIKFTGSTLWISLKGTEGHSTLEVADDGPGIPLHERENIWKRFYQLDVSRNKEKNEGNGLGLSITRRIIDLHHGTITVEDRPGGGSVFRIKI